MMITVGSGLPRESKIRARMLAALAAIGRPLERGEFYGATRVTPSITAAELDRELARLESEGIVARVKVRIHSHHGNDGLRVGPREVMAYVLARKEVRS